MEKPVWTKPTLQPLTVTADSAGGVEAGVTENQTYSGNKGLNPSGGMS